MRITCPNCGAQYEVDARVIPDMGRDVQCSNCGHTWFQRPQSAVATSVRRVVEDPPVSPGPEADVPPPAPEPAAATRPAEAFPPIPPADPAVAPAAARPQAPDPSPADTPAEAERPTLDEATRALLREEAEREVQARAAERRPSIETQGDFDLPASPPAPRAIQRSADLSALPQGAGGSLAAAVAASSSRRDSLPDVESISSGLRGDPTSDESATDSQTTTAPRRGFGAGLLIPLLFVAAAALVYVLAPTLADSVPSLRAPLAAYVDSVNALRGWIATTLSGAG